VGWENGRELLSAPAGDAEAFARAVLALQRDEALWQRVRDAALERVGRECGAAGFLEELALLLQRQRSSCVSGWSLGERDSRGAPSIMSKSCPSENM
jgi:hypothetical protein